MLEGHLAGGVLGDGVYQRKSPGWTNNLTANGQERSFVDVYETGGRFSDNHQSIIHIFALAAGSPKLQEAVAVGCSMQAPRITFYKAATTDRRSVDSGNSVI